jgi:DNA polymerase
MSDFQKHLDACGKSAGVTFTNILFLDLETRSKVDLRVTGVEVYAADPSTEIMCAYFALNDGPIIGWRETDGIPLHEACPHLSDPETICCFHNAEFEPRILRHAQGIYIPIERILDSAAVARHAGLPGALEPLGAYFGFPKDMDGNKAMLKLSKPRKPSKANPDEFWRPDTKPEDFQTMYDYCARDVEVSREAMRRLPPMSSREIDIYAATYKMNERGIPVDRPSAQKMRHIAEATKAQMSADVAEQFGFTLSQVKELAAFLGLESADKAALRDYLKRDDILPEQRHVAEQRQLFAKSSTAKIDAFLARSSVDSKIHDGVIYGGAERTLRYSGAGIQPQNIPRGMGKKQDLAFEALNHDAFDVAYDDRILPTISDMLRGLITTPEGLYVGDYSQIEARVLAWFAGDTDLIDAFANGQDPYKMMAGKIYHKPTSEISDWERFLGKQTVLGCGYGLGHFGFMSMLDTIYDVQLEETEARSIVQAYRKNAPKIVAFWTKIGNALTQASKNVGKRLKINDKIAIAFKTPNEMHLILPSGRRLRYYDVQHTREHGWVAYGRLPAGQGYGETKIYPGKLTGHIVQSTARDVVSNAMVNLDKQGFPLILTVHDELVSLANGRFEDFQRIMSTPPEWLTDFPLATDAFETMRYRK